MLGFLYHYRKLFFLEPSRRRKAFIMVADLSGVEDLGLDAALMLTAEYHRLCLLSPNFRPWIADDRWPPPVRAVFRSLGLYGLVNAVPREEEPDDPAPLGIKLVPFISGEDVNGETAAQLIASLSEVAGGTPQRVKVYAGLIEAIKNARNHAYPEDAPPRIDRTVARWWGAGAYRSDARQLQFAVYDQGVGIPWTLPRKAWWQSILEMTKLERTDADVVAGAIEYGRSRTDLEERGNGLWTICDVVRDLPGSWVRIVSGRAQVTYFADQEIRRENFSNPFCGTLIEWTLTLPPEDELRAG